ncbi:hypothetical protein NMY22_g995 [Coprinellus aureogranulatus]|nr:hypothetical protein NMY22_g995 [Coprinellus aureogranulatus]
MSSAPPAIPQPQPNTGANDSPNPRDTQLTDDRPLSYATAADDTNIVSGEGTNRDDGSVSPNNSPNADVSGTRPLNIRSKSSIAFSNTAAADDRDSKGPFPEPVVEESEDPIDDAATETERPSRPGMLNRRSTFDNDRRSMFSTASGVTAADTQTRYVNMLLALDHIHPINNMLAFVFCWLLLAGFAVLPGTLRKTIPSFIQDQVNDEQVKEALSLLVQHVPLVAVAGSVSGVGLIGMVTMWIRWRGNYIWLIRNIFLPGCTNALAGLVSTLVSIFVLNSGQLDTLSIVVLSVVGGTTVFNLLMIIIYQFIMLGGLQREHQQQVGKHSAGKTGAAPRALLATRGHDDLATAVPACVVGGSLFYGDSNLFAGFSTDRRQSPQRPSGLQFGVRLGTWVRVGLLIAFFELITYRYHQALTSTTMPSSIDCLPQELLDSLVDTVCDDPATLKTLGLVSNAWYFQTRVHLFREIALGTRADPLVNVVQCARLHQVLETRPELRKLIQRFSLADGGYEH